MSSESAWPESAVAEVAVLNEALANAEAEVEHLRKSIQNSDRDHWYERAGELEAENERLRVVAREFDLLCSAHQRLLAESENAGRIREFEAENERLRKELQGRDEWDELFVSRKDFDTCQAENDRLRALVDEASYAVSAALNCPAHPWHGSDRARRWLMESGHGG